ncbi:ABC transporter permease [Dokdonella soli]|uniref:ABC transporter permease n=1 Tax=Dokdonella soli TaxID=529810 RepID=A0ABP3U2Q9_9GAMM
MNTLVLAAPRVSLARCYALEAKHEFLRLLRAPSFALPTLIFPAMFYLLFAVLFGNRGGDFHANVYLLATYGVFGAMSPGLFGFGVTVAIDRERGWMTLKRAQPMPPGAYLASKLAMAMLFAAIIFSILAVLATTFGGVRLPASSWLLLFVAEILGVLPFCAIGLFIGSLVSGQAAPAIANLIYLPMSFLSGLWMPLAVLPAFIAKIAPLWPAYHLGQLALGAVGQAPGQAPLPHILALAAFTIVFLTLARRRLVRAG